MNLNKTDVKLIFPVEVRRFDQENTSEGNLYKTEDVFGWKNIEFVNF